MKYKLFQGWWVRFYFCCALMMSTIVGILVFAVWAGEDMILWDVGLEGLYAVLWLCMIFMQRRLLTYVVTETSLDKGTQRKTTENELPSLTQCTA